LTLLLTSVVAPPSLGGAGETAAPPAGRTITSYARLPLAFEANQGQAGPDVEFLARGPGYTVSLGSSEAVLVLGTSGSGMPGRVRMRLVGANPAPAVAGLDQLPGKSHYFIGDDPRQWRTGIPHYARVRYGEVYPGIDLVFYGNQEGRLEHDFIVTPGADLAAIRFAFDGVDAVELDSNGDLILRLSTRPPGGKDMPAGAPAPPLRLQRPVVYQRIDGVPRAIPGRYVLDESPGQHLVSFAVGSYDAREPLVIDPVLSYSSYIGNLPGGAALAVDSAGNAYVTGTTTFGCAQNGNVAMGCTANAFVLKFNPDATALSYATHLGGGAFNAGRGIAVDGSGNAYVTGVTEGEFPTTPGAPDVSCDCGPFDFDGVLTAISEGFVVKLDPSGSIVYATYLGGTAHDEGRAIAVDAAGNAYVTGSTSSADFPAVAPLQPTLAGGGDAFVAVVNPAGTALLYATYLGGGGYDYGQGIAVDAGGDAYVTGQTDSTDFPTTTGAVQLALRGDWDAFVAKLDPGGAALAYSTYLGGAARDEGFGITVDAAGSAYVTGSTYSTDFPTTAGSFQPSRAPLGGDAFVTKLSATGDALHYATYLGGTGVDVSLGIAVDAAGHAHVTGYTTSSDFPVTSPVQAAPAGGRFAEDAFVAKLSPAGTALLYSTYLGGTSTDMGAAIALDPLGNAYIAGYSRSDDFPVTPGAFSVAKSVASSSFTEGFVAKVTDAPGVGIAVGPGAVVFPSQVVGTASAARTVRLLAAGSELLAIGVAVDGCGDTAGGTCPDFALSSVDCGASLEAGTVCSLAVSFTPSATGLRTGTISIEDNAPGSPHVIHLSGTGIASTPPTATFTYTCSGLACAFDGSGSSDPDGTITSYGWTFGDGATGSGPAVSHTYAAEGAFSVTLAVTDNTGLTGTHTRTVSVNVPPLAAFTFACSGLTCSFDGSGSSDPIGDPIASYTWFFGDGTTAAGAMVTHTYGAFGTYTVTLRVTNSRGATGDQTQSVTLVRPGMHIGDLDGVSKKNRGSWTASVTITVHDSGHETVAGATVRGSWTGGSAGSCTTSGGGQCTISNALISNRTSSVTFTVVDVTHATLTYESADNHDPDGNSTGTRLTVPKP
jgi:PKD repeat protein